MSRFARDDGVIPDSLAGAAAGLQASMERYTRDLIAQAEARASEITEQAARKAVDRGAGAAASAGAERMLEAIDLIESRVSESFATLRAEAETLLEALENVRARAGDAGSAAGGEGTDDLDGAMAELLFPDQLPD